MDQAQSSQAATNTDTQLFQYIIFAAALLLLLVATFLAAFDANVGVVSTIYGAAALCLLFAFLSRFKSFEYFGVLKAELNEVKASQEEIKEVQSAQSDDIGLTQVLSFVGIVSKHEIKHLIGLAAKGSHDVTYSQDLKNELKRLDDFGFIYPNRDKDPEMGLNTIDEKFGADLYKYRQEDKTEFNLKDYVRITDYGHKYIELVNKLKLPERPI